MEATLWASPQGLQLACQRCLFPPPWMVGQLDKAGGESIHPFNQYLRGLGGRRGEGAVLHWQPPGPSSVSSFCTFSPSSLSNAAQRQGFCNSCLGTRRILLGVLPVAGSVTILTWNCWAAAACPSDSAGSAGSPRLPLWGCGGEALGVRGPSSGALGSSDPTACFLGLRGHWSPQ